MFAVITTVELGKLLHQHGGFDHFPGGSKTAYKSTIQWLEKNGYKLEPTFPDTNDEGMQTYFSLATNSPKNEIDLKSFLKLPGIDGAYEKPMDDMPI